MKKDVLKISKIIVPVICLTALIMSVQYSNSSKALLLKDNIEAISESTNGGDPGQFDIVFSLCYEKLLNRTSSNTNRCNEESDLYYWDATIIGNPLTLDALNKYIYPCNSETNTTPAWKCKWGYCYSIKER